MTTQITALAALLRSHGIRAWEQDVYIELPTVGDIEAVIEMDAPARDAGDIANWYGTGAPAEHGLFEGCALRVFWRAEHVEPDIAAAKQLKHDLMQRIARAMIADGCPPEAWTVCADWRDIIL